MATDTLNVKDFARKSGLDEDFILSHPAILKLVRQAIKGDWLASPQGKANFQKAFEQTPWYQNNASYARQFLLAQAKGGADFDSQVETAQQIVAARATALGAVLDSNALTKMAKAYLQNGWGQGGREAMLDQALTGSLPDFNHDFIDYEKGGPDKIIATLRDLARANGIKFTDQYFSNAANAVLGGQSTLDDYAAEIRGHAASRFPIFSDRLKAGQNVVDVASPYITRMADKLDLDPNNIDVNDPWILKALGGVDKDGNPSAMSLWDFEKSLKRHEDWQYSKDASNEIGGIANKVISMFSGVSQ